MDWQTLLDETAERLERRGAADLASICDAVGAHVSEPRVTALLDYVADELDRRGDTALASRIDEANETVAATVAADTVLRESAPSIFNAVQQYGAQGYTVQGDTVELNVDRGGVQTLLTLAFASRDDQGNPRLRVAFRCGEDQMVRWATLAELTPDRITEAVGHVCTTGQDYGGAAVVPAGGVTAARNELPMGDEKTHYWPEIAGWDGGGVAADALGYAHRYEYEYDDDPRVSVVFDASNFDKVKSTRPGTWDARVLDAKVSGTWTGEKDIPGVLKKLVVQFNKAKAKRISDIGQTLPKVSGWELLWDKSDPEDANYSKQPEWNSDFSISVTFYSVLESEGGYKTWMASLSDHGGYERAEYLEDDGRWDKLTDIPKILKRFEQDVEKLRKKKGW